MKDRYATQRGANSPHAKLTESQVRGIRASEDSTRHLAAEYGVSQTTIILIKKGKTWTHV